MDFDEFMRQMLADQTPESLLYVDALRMIREYDLAPDELHRTLEEAGHAIDPMVWSFIQQACATNTNQASSAIEADTPWLIALFGEERAIELLNPLRAALNQLATAVNEKYMEMEATIQERVSDPRPWAELRAERGELSAEQRVSDEVAKRLLRWFV